MASSGCVCIHAGTGELISMLAPEGASLHRTRWLTRRRCGMLAALTLKEVVEHAPSRFADRLEQGVSDLRAK